MTTRPNIVMFMPDQLRADAVGCFGGVGVSTPNIDALADEGTCFDNAFANHPVCGPSRVSLMTGWYPHVNGNRTLTNLLKPHEPNLLRSLKDSGYTVVWAGTRGDTFAPGVTEDSTNFAGFTVRPTRPMNEFTGAPGPLFDAYHDGRRPGDPDGAPWLDFDEAAIRTVEEILADPPPEPWVMFVALISPTFRSRSRIRGTPPPTLRRCLRRQVSRPPGSLRSRPSCAGDMAWIV